MGEQAQDDWVDIRSLDDDDLYTLFAWADEHDDGSTALQCNREITRRCQGVHTIHHVPGWLLWLPKAFWHAKPDYVSNHSPTPPDMRVRRVHLREKK